MTHYDRAESRDLEGADISGLSLRGAIMRECDLRGADLTDALFDGGVGAPAELRERIAELEHDVEDLHDELGESPRHVVTLAEHPLTPGDVVYLASPYTDDDSDVERERYFAVRAVAAVLLAAGVHVYSPIVHCHPMAKAQGLPTDAAFWRKYNFAMVERCDCVAVLTLDGWDESRGVAGEIAHAQKHGKPVHHLTIDE